MHVLTLSLVSRFYLSQNPAGKYTVKLFVQNEWRMVEVDDKVTAFGLARLCRTRMN